MWLVDSWHMSERGLHTNKGCLVRDLTETEFDEKRCHVTLYYYNEHDEYDQKCEGSVALRRLGEYLFWMPTFPIEECDDENHSDGTVDYWECPTFDYPPYNIDCPPAYLAYEASPIWNNESFGIPIFTTLQYREISTTAPCFPEIGQIPLISSADAARILQWSAPISVLGRFPKPPTLRSSIVLAVTEGDLEEECAAVQNFLDTSMQSDASLMSVQSDTMPIEFHLDTPDFRAWSPLGRFNEAELVFNLEPLGTFARQA